MKLSKHAWAIWGIALTVVIALMALIPFARTVSWWLAAGCTVLMFAVCAYTFVLAFRKEDTLESKVLGWPIFQVGFTALIAQIVVGAVLMGIAFFCPVWVTLIVELLVFAGTGICLAAKDAAREAVRSSEAALGDKTGAWRAIRSRADAIAASTADPELQKLAEAIRFADPAPTVVDGQIADMLEKMEANADANAIRKAFQLLRQRTAVGKDSKRNGGQTGASL